MRGAIIFVILLCIVILPVYFSTSYRLSRESKDALNAGDYQQALNLATTALEENPYNRQAFGVFSQSQQRLNFQKFLQNTKSMQQEAFNILKSGSLSPEEFLRLKWITEEFNRDYRALLILNNPTPEEKSELEQFEKWFVTLQSRLEQAKTTK